MQTSYQNIVWEASDGANRITLNQDVTVTIDGSYTDVKLDEFHLELSAKSNLADVISVELSHDEILSLIDHLSDSLVALNRVEEVSSRPEDKEEVHRISLADANPPAPEVLTSLPAHGVIFKDRDGDHWKVDTVSDKIMAVYPNNTVSPGGWWSNSLTAENSFRRLFHYGPLVVADQR